MSAAFATIPKFDLAGAAIAQIRDSILLGELVPGDELPSERELAVQLGLNRTTVREVLNTLELSGLIDRQHGRRCQVLDFRRSGSIGLVSHLARLGVPGVGASIREAMSITYQGTAALAAQRRTPEGCDELDGATATLERAVAARDHPAIVAADRDFHHVVASLADSVMLEFLVTDFYRAFDASLDRKGSMKRSIPALLIAVVELGRRLPHRRMADAIAAGDETVARAMAHLMVAGGKRP